MWQIWKCGMKMQLRFMSTETTNTQKVYTESEHSYGKCKYQILQVLLTFTEKASTLCNIIIQQINNLYL